MRRPGNLRFRGKLEIAQSLLEPRRTRSRLPWNRAPATLEQGPGYLGTGPTATPAPRRAPRLPWNRAPATLEQGPRRLLLRGGLPPRAPGYLGTSAPPGPPGLLPRGGLPAAPRRDSRPDACGYLLPPTRLRPRRARPATSEQGGGPRPPGFGIISSDSSWRIRANTKIKDFVFARKFWEMVVAR